MRRDKGVWPRNTDAMAANLLTGLICTVLKVRLRNTLDA